MSIQALVELKKQDYLRTVMTYFVPNKVTELLVSVTF